MEYSKFRLRNFTELQPVYYLLSGSSAELPRQYCMHNRIDNDRMFYCIDICAIPWNRRPPRNFKGTVLRINSEKTPPGFVRLQIESKSENEKPVFYRRPPAMQCIETGGPSWAMKWDIMTEKLKGFSKDGKEIYETYNLSSPIDKVYAVYCPYWPSEAEEWRTRKRFHGWPDEQLIKRAARGGCHFISKLRTWDVCDDREWRFSFSKAELILIHSWTEIQKRVYYCIRVLKRRISFGSDEKAGLAFQSYFFKTLMFWACEEMPSEIWNYANIGKCISRLLLKLHDCLVAKHCPNYFIPKNNVMSHLKDKGCFERELKELMKLVETTNEAKISFYEIVAPDFRIPAFPFEYWCLTFLRLLFPINEELNGRIGQYLTSCEWFLPEMKYLHRAIENHLSLMSSKSLVARQESESHFICLKNFNSALGGICDFSSLFFSQIELSHFEAFNSIFRKRHLRNSVPIYRRCAKSRPDDDTFQRTWNKDVPSPLHGLVAAYRANFYFTALKSYGDSMLECSICFNLFRNMRTPLEHLCSDYIVHELPVLASNSLSPIFDEHLQVILGFVTLHKYFTSLYSQDSANAGSEVCLKLNASEFLKYIFIQCQYIIKLPKQPIYIRLNSLLSANSALHVDQMPLSQLTSNATFSDAILYAAIRQSGAYRLPSHKIGRRLPEHLM